MDATMERARNARSMANNIVKRANSERKQRTGPPTPQNTVQAAAVRERPQSGTIRIKKSRL